MKRREFITLLGGAVVAWPLTARAQQGAKVPRIGFLYPGPQQAVAARLEALLNGLRTAGYSAPAQVEVVVRSAEGDPGRIGPLMEEIIKQNVDAIFAIGPAVVQAARSATRLIPINYRARSGDGSCCKRSGRQHRSSRRQHHRPVF